MYEIPTSILIGEQSFPVRNKGDFRMVLDCFAALEDIELTKQERIVASLIIFYDGMKTLEDLTQFDDIETAVKEMYRFFNCGRIDDNTRVPPYRLIDWEQDEQMICSAINKITNKEIRFEPYIHWWTFMGFYTAIGESLLSTVIGIREKIITGKKLEKYETKFRLHNPQYFIWNAKTLEEQEAEAEIMSLWNAGE